MKRLGIVLLLFFLSIVHLFGQNLLPRSTPEQEGVNPAAIAAFIDAAENSPHEFHSLMILRHGKVITEAWWAPYASELKHTMYSVSKSFTATAIGFAVSEGKLSVNDKVLSFFPNHKPKDASVHLEALRVKDLLTMSVGHENDPTGKVVSSEDWVKTFLEIPIPYEPGTKFLYNTAATYMLSAILHQVTREKLLDYLKPRLFDPLGIVQADWEVDPDGVNVGGYGLRLKTEDMAKFGQLFLQNGKWQSQQIIPAAWIEEASSLKILQDPDAPQDKVAQSDWLQGYAYQMWRSRHNSYRADGAFGQYILILPEQDAVIAITSETSDMQGALNLVWDYLLPAFDNIQHGPNNILKNKVKQVNIKPLGENREMDMEGKITGQLFETAGQSLSLEFADDRLVLHLVEGAASYSLSFGSGAWLLGETDKKGPYLVAAAKGYLAGLEPYKVAGSFTWTDGRTLELHLRYVESPHTEILRIKFENGNALMEISNSFNQQKIQRTYSIAVAEEV